MGSAGSGQERGLRVDKEMDGGVSGSTTVL